MHLVNDVDRLAAYVWGWASWCTQGLRMIDAEINSNPNRNYHIAEFTLGVKCVIAWFYNILL